MQSAPKFFGYGGDQRLNGGDSRFYRWGAGTKGDRDALRTTHQNQHNFFQGSFLSSIQYQYKSILKPLINVAPAPSRIYQNFHATTQHHRDFPQILETEPNLSKLNT